MKKKLLQGFKTYIENESLIKNNDKIVLAVSGGYDSTVLLDLFHTIGSEYHLKFVLAHVNHSLRDKSADRDEVFVRNLALNYDIKFFSTRVNVKQYAKTNKLSTEQAARYLRLNYLNFLRKEINYDKIALGHNADDMVETIMMNLIRGYGIKGLRGIKPKYNYLIHPLLFATRNEIVDYAEAKRLDHVEDESNQDTTFFRNKIRHSIVPVLVNQFGPQTIRSMCKSGKILSEIEEYIHHATNTALQKVIVSETNKEIVLDIDNYLDYFIAIKKSIILHLLEKMYGQYTYNTINSVLELIEKGKSNNRVEVGKKGIVIKHADKVYFTIQEKPIGETELKLEKWNCIPECGIKIKPSQLKKIDKVKHDNRYLEYIDFNTVDLPLKVRSWIKGDTFIPLGMSGTKKLHDFFIDEGVANFKRNRIPVLTDTSKIVWIVGYRINEQVKISEETNNILRLEVKQI
ncbi:MAG: tRNA lysidine(34) synthetase TilS [bacterium]